MRSIAGSRHVPRARIAGSKELDGECVQMRKVEGVTGNYVAAVAHAWAVLILVHDAQSLEKMLQGSSVVPYHDFYANKHQTAHARSPSRRTTGLPSQPGRQAGDCRGV